MNIFDIENEENENNEENHFFSKFQLENQRNNLENEEKNDDEEDDENYTLKVDEYLNHLKESCIYFTSLEGTYQEKLEAYITRRKEESIEYLQITQIPRGKDGDLSLMDQHGNVILKEILLRKFVV